MYAKKSSSCTICLISKLQYIHPIFKCSDRTTQPLGLAFHHQDSTFVNAYCQASMNLPGNDPEPSGLAFHHQGSTFINEKKLLQRW